MAAQERSQAEVKAPKSPFGAVGGSSVVTD
jgi:hypothetical protein